MKRPLFTLLFFFLFFSLQAQTIFGKWYSKDQETGKIDSVVEVYEKEGEAFAKIVEVLRTDVKNPTCINCKGKNKGKPILGLDILTGLKKDKDEWSGGEILDPRNGKVYKCYIELVEPNKLKIRGYIGFSLFGKTIFWDRAE
jgi:uncharacterized protein (DUF2147 family)